MRQITKKALYCRIGRKLMHDGEVLHTTRGMRWWSDLGDYYSVDFQNHIARTHIELEELGRELGVLRAGEQVKEA